MERNTKRLGRWGLVMMRSTMTSGVANGPQSNLALDGTHHTTVRMLHQKSSNAATKSDHIQVSGCSMQQGVVLCVCTFCRHRYYGEKQCKNVATLLRCQPKPNPHWLSNQMARSSSQKALAEGCTSVPGSIAALCIELQIDKVEVEGPSGPFFQRSGRVTHPTVIGQCVSLWIMCQPHGFSS